MRHGLHSLAEECSKEMRTAGGQQDKIVRRELHQVFTNGTIVDDTYLTSDDANHCVAIKVGALVRVTLRSRNITMSKPV